ncbi:Inositol 2-dehydrogenase [bacterium HR17]|uniref:Inositol 2-dehydrogenase n=1 Tax=Candidatus Fervidibacter japonicus TaxID=2035412 RepID=A0A2H5X8L4_9BACT|nr:Inositol 2-dehydrogenase [bacterium HR17]
MARTDWGIGIVGLGGIANTHLQAYRNAGLKVIGGADIDAERAKAMQDRWQLPFVTTDWRELIDHPEVRIVDITVPHKLAVRLPIVEYAAQRSKALFVQKPLLPCLEGAKQLVEVAERYKAPLMVNQNSVFVPAFLAMERYLRDGTIGTPYYCQIENRAWVDVSGHAWFGKDERWVTSDMAIHHFALVHHWFGEWDSVYALMGRDPSQTGVRGDNWSVVSVRFKNGVQACIINNWAYRGNRPRPHSREEIVIQGDKGCITGDSEDICVVTVDPPARIYPQFQGKWFPDAFANAMCHFIDALEAGRPFWCSGCDNLNAVAIAEAAYISAKERRAVQRAELL